MANDIATTKDPLRQAIMRMTPEFQAALPAHVTPDKFVRVTMTAINSNPDLRQADKASLFGAIARLAQDGLLPDGREAALVIFNAKSKNGGYEKRVQAMPMICGLLKLMRQSGEVAWVDAHIVHENDRFQYRPGMDEIPVFEPDWFGDRGKPIGAYAVARLNSGEIVPAEIMSVAGIEKVRAVSRSKDSGPWASWWEQMALKTVLRRYLKRLPTSADVEGAFERDETMQAQFDGEPVNAVTHEPAPQVSRLDALEHHIEAETGEVEVDSPEEGSTPRDGAREWADKFIAAANRAPDAGKLEAFVAGKAEQMDGLAEQRPDLHADCMEALDAKRATFAPEEESESEVRLRGFRDKIAAATNARGLAAVDAEWVKALAAYDDEQVAEIDALLTGRRKELAA